MSQPNKTNGYILPTIIVISVITFASIVITLQYISATSLAIANSSRASAARFAAEAGTIHAYNCIQENIDNPDPSNALTATLKPNTSCEGSANTSQPEYLLDKDGRRSSYSVANSGVDHDILSLSAHGYSATTSIGGAVITNTRREATVKIDLPITSSTVTHIDEDPSASIFAASQVDTGADFTCGVISDRPYCWGDGDGYQLGTGTPNDARTPTRVMGSLANKKVSQIAAGLNHACAITLEDDQLHCWGANTDGQIGNNTRTTQPLPIAISLPEAGVSQVSAGRYYTCAIMLSGNLYCWGSGLNRKTGLNSTSDTLTPQRVHQGDIPTADRSKFTSVSASDQHTCAVANTKAYCWGSGQNYKNGQTSTSDATTPKQVVNTASLNVKKIDNGDEHSCLIADPGAVYCWGSRSYGKIGIGSTSGTQQGAIKVTIGASTDIATGKAHTCAIVSGKPWCWGNDYQGQVGDGSASNADRSTPTPAIANRALNGKNLTSIASMGTGDSWTGLHTCATATDFKIYCWGWGGDGQLGTGSTSNSVEPVAVSFSGLTVETIGNISQISTGDAHTCLIAANEPYCMGYDFGGRNGYGKINGSTYLPHRVSRNPPSEMPSTNPVSSISAGYEHTCAVNSGRAYCWGLTNWAKLGNNTGGDGSYWVPVRVHNITGVTSVSAGRNNTCAIASSRAYCWGRGTDGRNGTGNSDSYRVPARVTGAIYNTNIRAIDTGDTVSCALTDSTPSRMYCWGSNDFGELAQGSAYNYSDVPVQIDSSPFGNQHVSSMSIGEEHVCAVVAGNVYCWGRNSYGKLGIANNTSYRSTPTLVTGALSGKTIASVSAGYDHTCAVDTSGVAYCWGRNAENSSDLNAGRLGTGTTLSTNSPVQIHQGTMPSGSSITQISAGYRHTCATLNTGQAFCWGVGQYGRLGNNSLANQTTPTELYRGDPPKILITTETIRRFNIEDVILY